MFFELWCWWRLLRVPLMSRRSKQSILKEINPEYSWEGLMLMLKLQYFGHLMQRADETFFFTIIWLQMNILVITLIHFSCVWLCDRPPPPPLTWLCSPSSSSVHGFPRQEYWIALPFPPAGDLPDPGIEPTSLVSCIGRWVL